MKRWMGWYCLLCFLGTSVVASADNKALWQEKMKLLAQTMSELLPELVSRKGDPAVIEKGAKTLSELSHTLKPGLTSGKMMPPGDADPSLEIIAGKFSEETKYAYRAIKAGNLEYGKNMLRSATAYCISCHTRHDKGPEFPVFPLNPKTERLSAEEKAELFVATRQFDKALEAYDGLIKNNELAKSHPFEWEKAVRQALAIAVRVKNDPQLTSKIVQTALHSPSLPEYVRGDLTNWQKGVEQWKAEPKKEAKSEAELAKKMQKFMKAAREGQVFPADRASEVQYLRASGFAHELLRVAKDPKTKAEGLLTVGIASETLANPVMWPMHELYYEACVRQLPHSAIAMQCFEHYEQAMYAGYTGSAGTNIPEDAQVLMAELKALAKKK